MVTSERYRKATVTARKEHIQRYSLPVALRRISYTLMVRISRLLRADVRCGDYIEEKGGGESSEMEEGASFLPRQFEDQSSIA
jgi:hypothetical protein